MFFGYLLVLHACMIGYASSVNETSIVQSHNNTKNNSEQFGVHWGNIETGVNSSCDAIRFQYKHFFKIQYCKAIPHAETVKMKNRRLILSIHVDRRRRLYSLGLWFNYSKGCWTQPEESQYLMHKFFLVFAKVKAKVKGKVKRTSKKKTPKSKPKGANKKRNILVILWVN